MEAATLAVIRASRPKFRSRSDAVAYALHAFLLAEGLKLVATGPEAEDESADFASSREEVDPSGWDALEDAYAFRYQDTEGKRAPLYIKCLVVGDRLLVHWVAGPVAAAEPATLELPVSDFTTGAEGVPACYQHMDRLVSTLQQHFATTLARSNTPSSTSAAAAAAAADRSGGEAGGSGRGPQRGAEQYPPEYYGGEGGHAGYRPPPSGIPQPAWGVGMEDVVPPGVRPPGLGPQHPGLPGLMEGPPRGGGGMQVGPDHPMFGPGRLGGRGSGGLGGPGGPTPPGLPPGARWDPIRPPGLPGFHPGDFQQGQRDPSRPHPDIMQPGPGGGPDWDAMFG